MKKVILTTIIFISSFFFFNLKDVSAATYDRTITDDNLALINDDFLNFRNQVLEFVGDSKIYIIYYVSEYRAIIADNDSSYSLEFNGVNYNCWFVVNGFDIYKYQSSGLTLYSSITTDTIIPVINASSTPAFLFLDTNIDSITSITTSYFRVNYNSVTYYLPEINSSLYSIYLENFAPAEPDDPYEEEKTLLSTFYVCVIEKIAYLANTFATNYIFLTILGVFIVIYVIELFRRLLR